MDPTQPQHAEQATPPPIAVPSLTDALKPPTSHGRTGKVARLPKAVRDRINTMILDGTPYLKIIEILGPECEGLTDNNLSTWKTGGYLDWLRSRQIAEAIQAKYEFAEDLLEKAKDGNDPGRAILHTMATNLCRFLADTDPATIHDTLLSDSDKFTRFVNAMVRLAEGGIKCEIHKFRAQDRSAEAAKSKAPAASPGISEESLQTAEQSLRLL